MISGLIWFLFLLVNADIGNCFDISHSRIEISIAPSKDYTDSIAVKNTEKGSLIITVRIENWTKAVPSLDWLKVSPLELELNEGASGEIRYEVKVPKEAKGELNAMIFIEGKPKEIAEGSIGINTSIGVPIYATIAGTEQVEADIEELKAVNKFPLSMELKIKNSGNVHIRPKGTISVKTKEGKELFTVPLNEYNYPVLPDSSRTWEIKANKKLENGEYTADVNMLYRGRACRTKKTIKVD